MFDLKDVSVVGRCYVNLALVGELLCRRSLLTIPQGFIAGGSLFMVR